MAQYNFAFNTSTIPLHVDGVLDGLGWEGDVVPYWLLLVEMRRSEADSAAVEYPVSP